MIVIVDFIVTVSNTVNLMKLFYAELYEICERDKWSCDSQLKADNKDRSIKYLYPRPLQIPKAFLVSQFSQSKTAPVVTV